LNDIIERNHVCRCQTPDTLSIKNVNTIEIHTHIPNKIWSQITIYRDTHAHSKPNMVTNHNRYLKQKK